MSAQVAECMTAIVLLAAEQERLRGELARLEQRVGADVEPRLTRLVAVETAVRVQAEQLRSHVSRPRRLRAYRAARWRAWWPTIREGLGLGAAAVSLYGLLWAVLALGALL